MTSAIIIGFDSIVIFSLAFGLLLLCTAICSSEIRRQPTWYGFLVPLFIYDIILLLGMGYQTDTGPPEGFCIFQAVLLYSMPGWIVMAFGCFIITVGNMITQICNLVAHYTKFYFDLKDIITAEEKKDYSPPRVLKRTLFLLLIIPLVFFSGFISLNGLVVALDTNRPRAILNGYKLYCTPRRHIGLYVGGTAVGIGMLIWILVIVKAGILFHRHSLKIRGKSETIYHRFLSVYIRVAAISIAGSLCVGLYVSSYATNNADHIFSSYCLSFPSIIIFCVFGSQRDIIQAWAFWRRWSRQSPQDRSLSSTSSFSATASYFSTTPIHTETRVQGNWRKLGYNWNSKSKPP